MARRVSWTNNSSGHDGAYVYRAEALDPNNLPAPVATVGPVAQGATAEWVDSDFLSGGNYEYAVQDYSDAGVGPISDTIALSIPLSLDAAQVGDEIEGGIYAGILDINGANYHIIAGVQSSELFGLRWKTARTATSGTASASDGLANTLSMQSAGISSHPAAEHCIAYSGGGFTDWYMPATQEIELVMNGLRGHPEFSDNTGSGHATWASTRHSTDSGVVVVFSNQVTSWVPKDDVQRRTRPIRRVAV